MVLLLGAAGAAQGANLSATLAQWGASNSVAQINQPASLTNCMAIAAGSYHSLAVRSDGAVIGWGDNAYGKATPPAGLASVVEVAAGYNHSVARRSDGSVITWGDPQMTNTPAFSSTYPATAIAAGEYFSMALYAGSVYVWGASPPTGHPNPGNVTAIAAGRGFCVAVQQVSGVGRVVVWGSGSPQPPAALANGTYNVLAVAAGESHCVAILSDYTLVAWGNNYFGQLNYPSGTYNIVGLSAKGNYTLARRSDGAIFGWGDNSQHTTTPPTGLSNVVAVAAGTQHALALYWAPLTFATQPQSQTAFTGDRVVFSVSATGSEPVTYQWKRNSTNLPAATNATYIIPSVATNQSGSYTVTLVNPVSTITSTAAVLTVFAPPEIVNQPEPQSVPQGNNATFSVTASGSPPLGYQWRKNGTNILNAIINPLLLLNVQPADAAAYSVVITNIAGAITSSAAALTVLLPPTITGQPQSQTVPAGVSVTFSVATTGATNYQWRKNGQPIDGANDLLYTLNNVQTNDAGSYSVRVSNAGGYRDSQAAILTVQAITTTNDGSRLVAWGQDTVFNGSEWVSVSPPGGLSNAVAIAVGGNHSLVLQRDGTVLGWGDNTYGQASAPPGLSGVCAIAAGLNHSLALRSNGTVIAWGNNAQGQTNIPANLTDVNAIACGAEHCLVLRANGALSAWGSNGSGQATIHPNATNAMAIAAGKSHNLILRANGTVFAWGGNDSGQLAVPATLTNATAIAAGDSHSLALLADGTMTGWGANDRQQLVFPPEARGIIAIAAGGAHNLAVLHNHSVVAWGYTNYAQCRVPAGLDGVFAIAAGPARSLALRLKPLRLFPPVRTSEGFRLTAGNLDASPLENDRLARLDLTYSTNWFAASPLWQAVSTTPVLANSRALMVDSNSPASGRIYRLRERP
jgi:alpha-tubulin suppressor-like RCC1 family protein